MWYVFMICAVFGGTILVCQTILTMLGLLGDSVDTDLSHDVGAGPDVGGDLAGDAGGEIHGDFHGDVQGDSPPNMVAAAHGAHDTYVGHAYGTVWLFKMLSFRTIVAALAFFGIAGLAGLSADLSPLVVLVLAAAAGLVAMYGVYWLMQTLYQLRAEGTVRIERAVGLLGSVYLRIPAERSGEGKVTLNLQNRTMEYAAMTAGSELRTGSRVVVTGVIGPGILDVVAAPEADAALPETERDSYA